MDANHLNYVLDRLPDRTENIYGPGVRRAVIDNYRHAADLLDIKYRIDRNKRGRKSTSMLRRDGTLLAKFEPARLPTCPQDSKAICNSKVQTAQILDARGIKIPLSNAYHEGQLDQAKKEAYADRDAVVVKAHSLTLGRGVYLNVRAADFEAVYKECIALQKEANRTPIVLVQEMIQGFEMRATVVEGVLDNLLVKIPAYVTGDGQATIGGLIDEKNARRSRCGYFGNKTIIVDRNLRVHMESVGISMKSVPAAGENVLLTSISNIAYGGETAIVTDLASQEIKDEVLRSVAAIPGVTTAGVDVMVSAYDSENPKILEVNTFPHMSCIHPYYGQPSDTARRYLESVQAQDKVKRNRLEDLSNREREYLYGLSAFYDTKAELQLVAST